MNLPNKLSLMRIAFVPVAAVVFLCGELSASFQNGIYVGSVFLQYSDLLVLLLFAAASITDFLDGYIARRNHLITSFGKFIDPIADKLLVNTLLILLAWSGRISVIAVLLMIARDTIVDGLRMNAASSGKVVAAGYAGKVKTVMQMLAIIFILLHDVPFAFIQVPIGECLLWIAVAASLYSGVLYFVQLKDIVLESM